MDPRAPVKRPSIEMGTVGQGRPVSPPAPPAGTDMRAWFAGLALGNPELMKTVAPEHRVGEALRLADELMFALVNKVPSVSSMSAPTETEMQKWDDRITTQTHVTSPARALRPPSKVPTQPGIPAPSSVNVGRKTSPGGYSIINND